jgi:hypothetical protein
MMVETTEIGEYCRENTSCSSRVRPTSLFVFDPLQDGRWSELVRRHPSSSVFHSTSWLSALQSTYGYEPVVYTTCGPSSNLTSGIVFCKVESGLTGRRLVSLPFSDHCDPLVESGAEFNDLLLPIRQNLGRGKWDYCEVRPVRFEPDVATMMGQSARYVWHTIDLRPDINAVHRKFHHSVERKMRRAEREGLVYEEGNSDVLLQQFYQLLVGTRRRQHLPPQPLKWFRNLIASFGTDLRIRVASKSGTPIASILTLRHKNTVTYKYGCSDDRFHPLGGVALVLWNTIQQAKAEGYQQLDLGRSDNCNEGLHTFKEHWGGIRSDLHYWRCANHHQSYESLARKMIVGRIVKALPDRALIAMGNLLYRHIG